VELLREQLRPDDPHFPRTRLVALENTHNLSGGRVLPRAYVDEVGRFARDAGLALHIDGARIMNAAVALGIEVAVLAAPADSVTLCLSKGLGAPAGTLLMGGAGFIAEARRARKLLGGGMRQAGVLAAPALLALEGAAVWLAEDHRRARQLAAGLEGRDGLEVLPPETNIVVVSVPGREAAAVLAALADREVLAVPFGAGRLRLVTHRDVGDRDVSRALEAFDLALQEVPRI
jgi:threonine aldolase